MDDSTEYRTKPHPNELVWSIMLLPVTHRRKMVEIYIGKKVTWNVTLQYIRPGRGADNHRARVLMLDRGHEPWIYCDVILADYPQLNSVQQGYELSVMGEIADIVGKEITLTEATLKL